MHSVAKITLGLGGVALVIGIVLLVIGGNSAGDIEEFTVEDDSVWSGGTGSYTHEIDDDSLFIFVSAFDEIRCDEFTLDIVRSDGQVSNVAYFPDMCTADGKVPEGYADDPLGWYHLGSIRNLETGVSYDLTTSDDFSAVSEDLIVELIGGIFGAILGFGGGASCACCGVFLLFIGLVLALTMSEEKPTSFQIDQDGRIILDSQPREEISPSGDDSGELADEWYKQTGK